MPAAAGRPLAAGPAAGAWRRIAQAVGVAFPRECLHPAVREWTAQPENQRTRWALAFSGGADSLVLLLLLCAQWPARLRRGRIVALHFDHRLRGRASTADARWCARVCAALGVPLIAGRWHDRPRARPVSGGRDAGAGVSEAQARAARLAFFTRELRARRIRALFFGHQLDDIAETMLMRLARGSGTGGLAAPRPVQGMPAGRVHLRPLLAVPKSALISTLRAAGAVWREDATNTTTTFTRNRHRARVVPVWCRAVAAEGGRDALAGAALSRERLEEDDVALEFWVQRTRALPGDGTLRLKPLRGLPRAVVRRALHHWLLEIGAAGATRATLSRAGFDDLLRAVETGVDTRRSLGKTGFATIRRGRLRWVPVAPVRESRPTR